jgi:hypothetical protein
MHDDQGSSQPSLGVRGYMNACRNLRVFLYLKAPEHSGDLIIKRIEGLHAPEGLVT